MRNGRDSTTHPAPTEKLPFWAKNDGRYLIRSARYASDTLYHVGEFFPGLQAVAKTVEYARSKMGEQAWNEGMNPEKAKVELRDNPYTYTDRERAKTAQQQE